MVEEEAYRLNFTRAEHIIEAGRPHRDAIRSLSLDQVEADWYELPRKICLRWEVAREMRRAIAKEEEMARCIDGFAALDANIEARNIFTELAAHASKRNYINGSLNELLAMPPEERGKAYLSGNYPGLVKLIVESGITLATQKKSPSLLLAGSLQKVSAEESKTLPRTTINHITLARILFDISPNIDAPRMPELNGGTASAAYDTNKGIRLQFSLYGGNETLKTPPHIQAVVSPIPLPRWHRYRDLKG